VSFRISVAGNSIEVLTAAAKDTNEAKCNLHLELITPGEPHHVVEALFKAFARAVDFACQRDPRLGDQIPSSKGKL
jgi:imidazoleglycerol-phosphate dehydratase